jgi:hypothetical protein
MAVINVKLCVWLMLLYTEIARRFCGLENAKQPIGYVSR